MESLRIVHAVQRFHPAIGGAETHVKEVAFEQARRGHDVTVATSAWPGAPARERMDAGEGASIQVLRFPARRFRSDYLFPPWLPMRGLEDALVGDRPDVLHAHSYRFATVEAAAAASRRSGAPLVVTAHGFYPPENPLVALARWRYDRGRGRRALAAASRCIAVTTHEVARYLALGVARDRIEVVPNGIPASAFAAGDGAGFRKRHALGDGPIVLFLARLAHDKGLSDLVRAAALVQGVTFAVAGRDAGAGPRAARLAQNLRIADRVRFLGPVDEPRDAYAACDVFALPSHYEAFGLVLLEAMAQSRAVVATDAGGMPEVVGDAGLVVPRRDPGALAEALRALLADPARRAAIGTRGRTRAEAHRWPALVANVLEVYAHAAA